MALPGDQDDVLCPSAQPDTEGAAIFAVVGGTRDEPELGYLDEIQPVTQDLLDLVRPVEPAEVFRFAAPCAHDGCQHFDGSSCTLAARTVDFVAPAVLDRLPPCRIRPRCRWYREQGKLACLRCPLVITTNHRPTADQRAAAAPPVLLDQDPQEESEPS
jgi:hypothetical protein